MKRAVIVAGLAALALAAIALGFYLGRGSDGEPPATGVAGIAPPKVPQVRPLFSLADPEGRMRSIAEWNGKALVINFWATWCPPCRREIPLLNMLNAHYASRGIQVIGVAVDFRKDVLAYLQQTPINYPVLIGEQDGLDVARSFGMQEMVFPFTVFTDQQGHVITMHVGELQPRQASLILATVGEVVDGRLSVAAARDAIRTGMAALARPAGDAAPAAN